MMELEQFIKILEMANYESITEYRIFRSIGINYYKMKRILEYAVVNGFLRVKFQRGRIKIYEITEKGMKLLSVWMEENERASNFLNTTTCNLHL